MRPFAAAALTVVLIAVLPSAAQAKTCSLVTTGDQSIGYYTRVISASNMTCARALALVRKYGGFISAPGAYRTGGSFWLGSARCRVTSANTRVRGGVRARCTMSGGRIFRVGYGTG